MAELKYAINDDQATEIGKLIQEAGPCDVQLGVYGPVFVDGGFCVQLFIKTRPNVPPQVYRIYRNGDVVNG
jgi:hypothetical protein